MVPMKQEVTELRDIFERELGEVLSFKECTQHKLYEAAAYSLNSGGKRLRPIFLLTTAQTLGAPLSRAMRAACAIECIHTYSMIHDDLPSMDDDDYRRGRPTLHRIYPEGHAILAGDFLLTYAFELIATDAQLSDQLKVKLIRLFSQASGGEGMIGGQVIDLSSTGVQLSLDELKRLHQLKTGALFEAGVVGGALVAGADEETLSHLKAFSQAIGLAFQIVDDILDVTQSMQKHGQRVGTDELRNKSTYATLLGIEGAKASAEQLCRQAREHLNQLTVNTDSLAILAEKIVARTV